MLALFAVDIGLGSVQLAPFLLGFKRLHGLAKPKVNIASAGIGLGPNMSLFSYLHTSHIKTETFVYDIF